MNTIKNSENIDHDRRRFLGAAASDRRRRPAWHAGLGRRTTGQDEAARDQAGHEHVSFGPLKQIDAGV